VATTEQIPLGDRSGVGSLQAKSIRSPNSAVDSSVMLSQGSYGDGGDVGLHAGSPEQLTLNYSE
jgi:hypothetical protein